MSCSMSVVKSKIAAVERFGVVSWDHAMGLATAGSG